MLSLLISCSTTKKIIALKPDVSTVSCIEYQKQLSTIYLPFEISVAEIQTQINKHFNGLIYEDNNLNDDEMLLKVWKQAPIIITENNGKLLLDLPLKIWTKIKYGTTKLGIDLYDTKEFNLNGIFKVETTLKFNNWQLQPNTAITDIHWVESPSIVIAGKNIPITFWVNKAANKYKEKIAKNVDSSFTKSIDVKQHFLAALEAICKPQEINAAYHNFMAMQPAEIAVNNFTVANKKILFNINAKAFIESSVNMQPTFLFDKNKTKFVNYTLTKTPCNIAVTSITTYKKAVELMQQNFKDYEYRIKNKTVKMNVLDMWNKDGKMVVAVDLQSGNTNGTFYLSGIPFYDSSTKEIKINDLDFVLDSKNKLIQFGDWLAHGFIEKKIQENCKYSIAQQLQEAELNIKNYLNNYQPKKGVFVNGQLLSLTPQQIVLTTNAMMFVFNAQGNASIKIEGM